MQEILNNSDLSQWVTAFATSVLALLTLVLVILTWLLAREARKSREHSITPNIVVTVEPDSVHCNLLVIIVENIGKGAAYNIRICDVNHNVIEHANGLKKKINDFKFFNISVLKPRQKITHTLGLYMDLKDLSLNFEVECLDINKAKIKSYYQHSLDTFEGLSPVTNSYDYNIAKFIESIAKSLRSVVSNGRISIDSYDRKETEGDRAKVQETYENRNSKKTE